MPLAPGPGSSVRNPHKTTLAVASPLSLRRWASKSCLLAEAWEVMTFQHECPTPVLPSESPSLQLLLPQASAQVCVLWDEAFLSRLSNLELRAPGRFWEVLEGPIHQTFKQQVAETEGDAPAPTLALSFPRLPG